MARLPVVRVSDVREAYVTYHRVTRRRAAGTVQKHEHFMSRLEREWGTRDLTRVTDEDIAEFIGARMDVVGVATLNQDVWLLRQFFGYLRKKNLIRVDPTADLEYENITAPQRWRLPVQRFQEFLESAGNPVERAMFGVCLFTFLRIQEALAIRIGDIYEDAEGQWFMKQQIFKTRKADNMRLAPALVKELKEYLSWYKRVLGVTQLDPDWYLLPQASKPGRRPKGISLHEWKQTVRPKPNLKMSMPERKIQYSLRLMGCPTEKEGGHTLRRSGARAWYDELVAAGVVDALAMVQAALHHSDPKMTAQYIGLDSFRLRRDDLMGQGMFLAMSAGSDLAQILQFNRKVK